MADIEKVMKALEYCANGIGCKDCPYGNDYDSTFTCIGKTQNDALELLKVQQEKINKARLWLKADGVDLDEMCEKLN